MSNNSIPIASFTDERNPYTSLDSESEEESQHIQSSQNESITNTDLLGDRLDSMNPKKNQSREQFYRESYKVFHELRTHLASNQSQLSQELALGGRDVNEIINKFIDLTFYFTEAEKYTRIWDLCQRLYFPMDSTDQITSIRDWLNSYEPIPDVDEARSNDEDEDLEEHNAIGPTWIWEFSRRHLLRGNFEEAREILDFGLKFMDAQQQTLVGKIIQLVQNLEDIMPTSDNKTLFWEKWIVWHSQCMKIEEEFLVALNNDALSSSPKGEEIWMIFTILTGNEEGIRKAGSYFEAVLGNVWFNKPQTSLSSLQSLAQDIDNELQDDPCSYLLMGEFEEAFNVMDSELWLHTHLGYALIITGNMISDTKPVPNAVGREDVIDPIYYSIQSYAQRIAQEYNMIEEAINYIECCKSNKEIWINQLLGSPILPYENMDRLQSLLGIATKFNLTQVESHIHQGLGHRYEHEKKIREATIEYGKAQDLKSLDRLAHLGFTEYLKKGNLNNVVSDMESLKRSPHYAILIDYYEFRQHLSHKQWQEASECLLHLIENQNLPPKFEIVLLIDNIQILKETTHYYPSEKVIQLLGIFKQAFKDSSNQAFTVAYYKNIERQDCSSDIIVAKIRERLAYKAATAHVTC